MDTNLTLNKSMALHFTDTEKTMGITVYRPFTTLPCPIEPKENGKIMTK